MMYTIYVRKENEEVLNSIKNKSEFFNNALSGNVNGTEIRHTDSPKLRVTQKPTLTIPGVVRGSEFVPKPPDPEIGYPCCQANKPCKHWVFDELDIVWRNTLTGKTKEA